MRIPSNPIVPSISTTNVNVPLPSASVEPAKAVTPVVAILETPHETMCNFETPSRPLLANMVSDFENQDIPTRGDRV